MDSSFLAIGLFFGIFISVLVIFYFVCYWKIFVKAGREGWEGIIPIYSAIIMLKIIGKPWWWILLYLVPIVNIVFAIWTVNMFSKSFGKDEGFTVGLILLSWIFIPIMAFSKNIQYVGPYGDPIAFKAFQEKKSQWDFNKEPNAPQ